MADESAAGTDAFDSAPTGTGVAIAAITGTLGVLSLLAAGVVVATTLALLGVVATLYGLRQGRRRTVTAGALLGAGGVVAGGAFGGHAVPVLVATVCLVVAWDAAETAVTNGEQVGTRAGTFRNEATHVGSTVAIASLGAGGSYAVYGLATGGLVTTAVLALVLGGGLLLVVLRS